MEQVMEERRKVPAVRAGRFLLKKPRSGRPSPGRWITVFVLLCWDGMLLYMILRCLIDPVYGAVFVAGVSVCLGYQF